MRTLRISYLAYLSAAMVWLFVSQALAQAPDSTNAASIASTSNALVMGDWHIHPMLELRTHAEYRRNPFDTDTSAPSPEPTARTLATVENQWWVFSRGRLGIAAERGPLRAVLELQDARLWGDSPVLRFDGRDALPSTAARLAFAELRSAGTRASFLRVGRQQIAWGDGRLLGASDWSPTGQSLDALRGMLVLWDFDVEAFASILVRPGATPAEFRRESPTNPEGSGVQLHGARVAWHVAPLLHIESNNLGRIARKPTDGLIRSSDLFVSSLRVWGAFPGLSYAVEGAYQVGRSAAVGDSRKLQAWAASAKARYDTELFWKLGFGVEGVYASGQNNNDGDSITRFDPVLPDTRLGGGPMGLYAWSNVIEAAGLVLLSPHDSAKLTLGYRYVAMAEPTDVWQTAVLTTVGADPNNTASTLGHELDAGVAFSPLAPLEVVVGYGVFVTGEGAKNVLEASGRGRPDMQHYGYMQLTARVP